MSVPTDFNVGDIVTWRHKGQGMVGEVERVATRNVYVRQRGRDQLHKLRRDYLAHVPTAA